MEPQKISYDEIEAIVEHLVRVKSSSAVFDCWEPEDIAQEIRIICFNALEHFDRSRVKDDKLVNYFGRCVDYRLQNLKRDKYIRFTPHFSKEQISKAESQPDSEIGKKYKKFKENVKRRQKVKHPVPIEHVGDNFASDTVSTQVEINDLREYLVNRIEERLRIPLLLMLDGDHKSVDKSTREEVQDFVEQCMEYWSQDS